MFTVMRGGLVFYLKQSSDRRPSDPRSPRLWVVQWRSDRGRGKGCGAVLGQREVGPCGIVEAKMRSVEIAEVVGGPAKRNQCRILEKRKAAAEREVSVLIERLERPEQVDRFGSRLLEVPRELFIRIADIASQWLLSPSAVMLGMLEGAAEVCERDCGSEKMTSTA